MNAANALKGLLLGVLIGVLITPEEEKTGGADTPEVGKSKDKPAVRRSPRSRVVQAQIIREYRRKNRAAARQQKTPEEEVSPAPASGDHQESGDHREQE